MTVFLIKSAEIT